MRKRIIKLTESDLEKIIKKVLSEQMPAPDMSKPVDYFKDTNQVENEVGSYYKDKVLNLWGDEQESSDPMRLTVKKVVANKTAPKIEFKFYGKNKFTISEIECYFDCNEQMIRRTKGNQNQNLTTIYNERLKNDLNKLFCSRLPKSKSGKYYVPGGV
jgi:hypothetical protein